MTCKPFCPSPPSIPTGLRAAGGTGKVVVSWNSSTGATEYKLYRRPTATGTRTLIYSGPERSFIDNNRTNGVVDYYNITAIGSGNANSGYSSTVSGVAIAKPVLNSATAGNNQVVLVWGAATGAAAYTVRRGTSSGSASTVIVGGITTTSYTDATAQNDTTYYYTIIGTNTTGPSASDPSNERSATPRPPIPVAPTGFTATPGDAQVSLSWTATQYAATYTVSRSTTSGSGYAALLMGTDITGTSFTDTTAQNGTTYYYVVKAKNTGGTGPNSSQVSATPVAVPPAPENLVGTPGNARANLSWNASPGATGYSVKRRTTPTGTATTVAVGNVTSHAYSSTNGTLYYFTVVATNSSGTSPESNQVSVTPVAPPVAPTGLAVTLLGDERVSLSWNAVSGATGYVVRRSTVSGGPYQDIDPNVAGTSYTNTVPVPANGTRYYYVVAAINASGASANSSAVSAIPIAAMGYLAAAAGTGKVNLSWPAATGATSYTLKRSNTSGGAYTTIASNIIGTTYPNTGLANGTKYYYVVLGANATGSGPDSAENFATPVAAPANVVGVAGDTSVSLSWAASAGADSYDVIRSLTPTGATTTIDTVTVPSSTNTNLVNGTAYYYVIVAKNTNGNDIGRSDASAQVAVTPNAIPVAPVNFRAVPGNAQITLSWDAVPNATSYKLIRSLTPNGATTTITLGNVTSSINSPLTNGTPYYYFVVAVNSGGTSPKSLQVSATPQVPSSIALTLAPTPSRCSQKTVPSSPGMVEIKGSLAVSGGYPPYAVVWAPTPAWQSPPVAPLPFRATFHYPGSVETFATMAPFPAITATITDAIGTTANISRNLVPCANVNACVMP